MSNKDFYKILGVAETATESEIKKAYRDLAKKYHPDSNPDKRTEERFKEISEAYGVLSNKEKKQQYDQMRKLGAFNFGGRDYSNNGQDFSSMFGKGRARTQSFDGFGDIFSQIFGGSNAPSGFRQQKTQAPGKDVKTTISIPMDLAIKGGKHVIHLSYQQICPTCHGSGQFCTECSGSGRSFNKKTLSITIPRNVEDGKTIRLKGQGEASLTSGPAGDLLVTINVQGHPDFERKGYDLYTKTTINLVQAALGTRVKVTTFDENIVSLKIPAGSKSGKLLKLTGLGIQGEEQTGDLYVEIQIETPATISKKGIELLESFAKEEGLDL